MSNTDGGTKSRFQMARRDFLVMSSAAALGVAASGFGSEVKRGLISDTARPFVVGYIDEVLTSSSTGVHRVTGAEQLGSGHHDFRNDLARVTVHGFWADEAPQSVAMAAYFKHDGNELPFLAWNHVQHGRFAARAPRSSFRVPVRADGSLLLGFDSHTPHRAPRSEMSRRLADIRAQLSAPKADPLVAAASNKDATERCTLGRTGVKLRRGTYVVAFLDKSPSWSSLRLALGETPLGGQTASPLKHGSSPVSFDYLLFSIDHA
jgi:hypothetical protein